MTEMPMYNDSPFYGYHVDVIQNQYAQRQSDNVVGFFLTHLKPGMTVLDCGCGAGDDNAGGSLRSWRRAKLSAATWSRGWWSALPNSRRARTSTT